VPIRTFFQLLAYATGTEVTVEKTKLVLDMYRDPDDDAKVDYFSFVTNLMHETPDFKEPDETKKVSESEARARYPPNPEP